MRLDLNGPVHINREFDYCATSFDNGVKYSVCYGGTHPLNSGTNGVTIGDVARFTNGDECWYATPDTGDAVALRWTGGFASRMEASLWLLGTRMERDRPAVSTVRGHVTPL